MKQPGAGEASGPRILIVVARDRQALYEYLRRGFADRPDIEVVLDRRAVPPARGRGPKPSSDLRERPDLTEELQERGFALIHLF